MLFSNLSMNKNYFQYKWIYYLVIVIIVIHLSPSIIENISTGNSNHSFNWEYTEDSERSE